MFPFVHWGKRTWIGPALLMASLVLYSLTSGFPDRTRFDQPLNDVDYLNTMEVHYQQKAAKVLDRFTDQSYTVDLNLELDAARTTTTTDQTGTWVESTDLSPRIKTIRCCVTLAANTEVDKDHLFRCLAYSLGVDLSRGDLLQICVNG